MPPLTDGGVWGNSPTLTAALFAHNILKVPFEAIKILAIGAGSSPAGSTTSDFRDLRPVSYSAITSILELMFASQSDFHDTTTKTLIGNDNFVHIDCALRNNIRLDDAAAALKILPGLAEEKYAQTVSEVTKKFPYKRSNFSDIYGKFDFPSSEMLITSGLTRITPARKFYQRFRKGAGTIAEYLETARLSIVMISVNLRTGMTFENITNVFKNKLDSCPEFSVTISLLNPDNASCIASINKSLNAQEQLLASEIKETLQVLEDFRSALDPDSLRRLDIRVHDAVPFASAILLDHEHKQGRIQLETKAYKEPLGRSFALELVDTGEDCLYRSLLSGYNRLLADGKSIVRETA